MPLQQRWAGSGFSAHVEFDLARPSTVVNRDDMNKMVSKSLMCRMT